MGFFRGLDPHRPWVMTFGIAGNIISFCVFLAPIVTFAKIIRAKSTMGFHSLPYTVALLSSLLWLYYAFMKDDAALLLTINTFGAFVETIYILIFLFYATMRLRCRTLLELVLAIGGFALVFVVTWFPLSAKVRVIVVGWFCVAFSVAVFAAPLSVVLRVLRTKSVEFLPSYLSIFLTLSAVSWFAYGLTLHDMRIMVPNIFGFFLGLLQIFLYVMYKKEKPVDEEENKDEESVHVINVEMLAGRTDQLVHPVDSERNLDGDGGVTAAKTAVAAPAVEILEENPIRK